MQLLRLDWNVIFTVINLLILYLAMKRFLIEPVTGIIEKRRTIINAQFLDAKNKKEEADELKAQYEKRLKEAGSEAAQIMEQARRDAGEAYAKCLVNAKEEAEKIIADEHKNMERERAKMEQELQAQVAELALATAKKILMESSNEATDQLLYDRFLTKAGELHDADGA